MTDLYILCHSIFSHLPTLGYNISVYAKMLESSLYKNASKNNSLPQSHCLHRTCYKVDFYIFVWQLIFYNHFLSYKNAK